MKAILFHAIPLVVLVVLSAANVRSQGIDLSLSREGQAAYDTLLVAQRFESDVIGYSAAPSKLVEAYNVILNEASAGAAFKSLLERATLPGKLYSLCGLFFTDYSFFRAAIEGYRHSDDSVYILFGCIGTTMRVSELIEAKNPIIVDINRPEESVSEYLDMNTKLYYDWSNRKKKKKTDRPPAGYQPDILNGGYPVMYRARHSPLKSGRVELPVAADGDATSRARRKRVISLCARGALIGAARRR